MNDLKIQTAVEGRFIGGGLFESRQKEEGKKPRYSACIVLAGKEDTAKINTICANAKQNKWGDKKVSGLQTWGVREGDEPEFETSYEKEFINPKSFRRPQILRKKEKVITEVTQEEGIVYPGCYVVVSVSAYAYDGNKRKNIKPGVTLNLRGVLFAKDGEPLGDIMNADSEFEGYNSEFQEAKTSAQIDDFLD